MSSSAEIQANFIRIIKEKLPAHTSLSEELAELLNISNDSAYRRIRGDTLLALDEVLLLSKHFHISIDEIGESSDHVSFQYIPIDHENYNIEKLFSVIMRDLGEASKLENAELYYLARDIPIFYLLQFKEIAAFKIFFWERFHGDPDLKTDKFHQDKISPDLVNIGRKIWQEYVKFPSTEIWGPPTFKALLDEIAFMWDSSQIEDKESAIKLCQTSIELITHLKEQAEIGYKFSFGTTPVERPENLKLYITDITLTHNKALIKGDIKRVYMPTSLDTLITSNEHYYKRSYQVLENTIKRSSLISVTGEKGRNRFVNECIKNAEKLLQRIEQS